MGAGKSTLGKQLAKKLAVPFFDLDHIIERQIESSISEFFDSHSEESFRDIEANCLRQIALTPSVVSVGGGTPCFKNNMKYMNEVGKTIYLEGSPLFLASRLEKSKAKRPLIADIDSDQLVEFIEKHLAERSVFYQQAHHSVQIPIRSSDDILEAF